MFDKVVFAGGGNRCWWQAGFWDAVAREIELRPRLIAGVAAGAATACLVHANESRRALAYYDRALSGRHLNVDVMALFSRSRPLFPHLEICRRALRTLLGGEHFRQLLWNAPEIRIVFARPPAGSSRRRMTLHGMAAYRRDRGLGGPLHPSSDQTRGFLAEYRRVQDCRSERELVDLLLASSASPPFTPLGLVDDEPAMDGGMVDSVPVAAVDDIPGSTLVLTTRHYPGRAPVFVHDGRVYVQPSRRVRLGSWDYTGVARFPKVYEQGLDDGAAFLRVFAFGRTGAAAWTPWPVGADVVALELDAEREALAQREAEALAEADAEALANEQAAALEREQQVAEERAAADRVDLDATLDAEAAAEAVEEAVEEASATEAAADSAAGPAAALDAESLVVPPDAQDHRAQAPHARGRNAGMPGNVSDEMQPRGKPLKHEAEAVDAVGARAREFQDGYFGDAHDVRQPQSRADARMLAATQRANEAEEDLEASFRRAVKARFGADEGRRIGERDVQGDVSDDLGAGHKLRRDADGTKATPHETARVSRSGLLSSTPHRSRQTLAKAGELESDDDWSESRREVSRLSANAPAVFTNDGDPAKLTPGRVGIGTPGTARDARRNDSSWSGDTRLRDENGPGSRAGRSTPRQP